MDMKGVYVELNIDNRIVFSCVVQKLEGKDFDEVWSVAGRRLVAHCKEALEQGRPIHGGQVRLSPVYP
jgi:hypothetical protein